jgi:hypothetical protein
MRTLAFAPDTKELLHEVAWGLCCIDDPPLTRSYIMRITGVPDTTLKRMTRRKTELLKVDPLKDLQEVTWADVRPMKF